MNDPWDVKSVRQPGQYVSCMKINGVPLLPPVLSKECRKEMQYYKLLAKEVEKRISVLQPYIADSDTESEDRTDAPELPENEENYELPQEAIQDGFNVTIEKIPPVTTPKALEKSLTETPNHSAKLHNSMTSNVHVESIKALPKKSSPKFVIDLSLKINEPGKNALNITQKSPPIEMPERDYNCVKKINVKPEKQLITEMETPSKEKREVVNFSLSYKDGLSDPISDFMMTQDGPSSLSSKSFTGSLNDLHSESIKDGQVPKLIRRGSYTLLKPSPQLLAHLEVQSISTGIEMQSISMSESLSNLSTPRKRRSWDLETAKVKWSSMAMELKQKNLNSVNRNQIARTIAKRSPQITPPKARSVIIERARRNSVTPKASPKSDPLPKTRKVPGPISVPTNRAVSEEPASPTIKEVESLPQSDVPALVSESDDPATRVRELYEKIQKQQLIQMASLVEKQKREQFLLQQVFEEQNTLLFKQLKTICPKSPIEAQEAWGDKHQEVERGPVSLSQLINHKSPDQSILDSPVSSTLTDTNNYINHCDNVLKKSRDITGSIKKQQTKSRSQNGTTTPSPRSQLEGSRTRTHSPNQSSTLVSRKLNYDTSASSDREYDPILTDRTNDTMADLNVTFPSDSDGNYNNSNIHHLCGKEMMPSHANSAHASSGMHSMFHTDSAIRSMERAIKNSINNTSARQTKSLISSSPTAKQRCAASRIVAAAKGYLVRRLMRTARVQATVQTIRDALLCALQLHQDRAGIRGADVDLHRRLIQQITAACYSLHDTFIASSPADRCAMISADRGRRRSLANRQTKPLRQTDLMSQSHTGAFPARAKRPSPSAMTQSNYETISGDKSSPLSRRHLPSPRRRPWR